MALVQVEPSLALGSDCLSRLPIELLLRITNHLTTTELCAVRLCSRSLESALRHFFLLEFFQRKQFMLTDFSLQTLLAIARHPVMSQSLRHVSFGVEEFCDPDRCAQSIEQALIFDKAVAQQKTLLTNGRGLQLLTTAFSLLHNLETVQLRDFPSRTRYRDGPSAAWTSYGFRSMREQLGKNAHYQLANTRNPDFSSRAFALIMAALAQANARPPNIKVLIHTKVAGLKDFAFDLTPMPCLNLPGISAGNGADVDTLDVLAGLRQLHLKLQFILHPLKTRHIRLDDPHLSGRSRLAAMESLPLHAWLAHCPKVEWLRLNLHKEARHYNDVFLSRLGSPLPAYYPLPPGSVASRNITMPFASKLRRLDLGIACCSPGVLLDVLGRFPALEHLSLYRFSLLYERDSAETPDNVWNKFLSTLAKSPLGWQLKKISLRRLSTVTRFHIHPYSRKTHAVKLDGSDGIKYTAELDKPVALWLHNLSISTIRKFSLEEDDSDLDDMDISDGGSKDYLHKEREDSFTEDEFEDGEDAQDEVDDFW
ncbi:hypothetical protein SEPCBS119000_004567 [Sporothrix epigloea]|uniref:F-box domain-containing protein n=1 Tax=Sporothrix epigloea TaxID=1892477 RepID=A0ABP0DU19_9PEZI